MRSLKASWAIAKREMHSFFVSPVAYAIMALFWLAEGIFFLSILNHGAYLGRQTDLRAEQLGAAGNVFNVPAYVAGSFLDITTWLLLFVVPIVAMGLLAEEKRRRTMELLLTSPVTNLGILAGKFLGAYAFLVLLLAPTYLYQLLLHAFGANEPMVWLTGYLGLLLLSAALLAGALLISALTSSQIVAAFGAYGLLLVLWFLDAPANLLTSPIWQDAVRWMSLSGHFADFKVGVVSLRDVNYYLCFVTVALFLTHMVLESIRWRGVRSR